MKTVWIYMKRYCQDGGFYSQYLSTPGEGVDEAIQLKEPVPHIPLEIVFSLFT